MNVEICFIAFTFAVLSLWFSKKPIIWGPLIIMSLLFGFLGHILSIQALIATFALATFWHFYQLKPSKLLCFFILFLSIAIKLRYISGFYPISITSKFHIGLSGAIMGFFPLVTLSTVHDKTSIKRTLYGALIGISGIICLGFIVTVFHVVHFQPKFPPVTLIWLWANLILTSIPEEAFFRGFIQKNIASFFHSTKIGHMLAVILTSILFTTMHIYWAPSMAILIFVFIASVLYGICYAITNQIESSMITHFLLNAIHMFVFSYHAI